MTTMLNADRAAALRTWMDERDMTIRYVAEQLGVSMTLARRYLMLWETVPTHWHRQLVLLGIPPELLPRAENKKRGPSRKIPVLNTHPAVCA